jgi:hypothetical protein
MGGPSHHNTIHYTHPTTWGKKRKKRKKKSFELEQIYDNLVV